MGIVRDVAVDAIRRAADYSWEKKAEAVNDIYDNAVGYGKGGPRESVFGPQCIRQVQR